MPLPLPPSSSGDGAALLWGFSAPLFCEPPRCVPAVNFSALPQFKKSLPPTALRAFWPVLTLSNAAGSSPLHPLLLAAGAGVRGTFLLGVAFRHVICGPYLISPPSETALRDLKASPGPASARVSWWLETSSIKTPFPGRLSVPRSLVSLFSLQYPCPTSLRRQWTAFLGA